MTDHQRGDTVLPEHPCITPNLTKFAEEGIIFTNTFCPTPHCCPSRATFHSGLYPSRHGVWNNVCNQTALSRGLNDGVRLWSEDLAEGGYKNFYSGKWHVSSQERPRDRGWEELTIYGYRPDEHTNQWADYERIAHQKEPAGRTEGMILRPGYGPYTLYGSTGTEPNETDEQIVNESVEKIHKLAGSNDPWVICTNTSMPHDPYFVPQKYLDMYDIDAIDLPVSYKDKLTDKPRIYKRMRDMRFGQLTEREVREAVRHFWATCSYLDDLFGRLLEALDATNQAENTLVLYCADHGDYCGDHGLFAKGIPSFRGAYNVPAVMRYPRGITDPGRRVEEFVSLADFAPTFVELAGSKADPDLTGRSLLRFLQGQTPADWPDAIFSQCNGLELLYTQRSVTTRQYKYVFNGFDDDELYDLGIDPHEMVNLSSDPKYLQIKHDLVRRMWQFAYRQNDSARQSYITVSLVPWGPAEALRQ